MECIEPPANGDQLLAKHRLNLATEPGNKGLNKSMIMLTKSIHICMCCCSHREKWSESSTPHAPRPNRPTSSVKLQQTINLHKQQVVHQHKDAGKYVCVSHSKLLCVWFTLHCDFIFRRAERISNASLWWEQPSWRCYYSNQAANRSSEAGLEQRLTLNT